MKKKKEAQESSNTDYGLHWNRDCWIAVALMAVFPICLILMLLIKLGILPKF